MIHDYELAELLHNLMAPEPDRRVSLAGALKHEFFDLLDPVASRGIIM